LILLRGTANQPERDIVGSSQPAAGVFLAGGAIATPKLLMAERLARAIGHYLLVVRMSIAFLLEEKAGHPLSRLI
jgi:hypothetical protein